MVNAAHDVILVLGANVKPDGSPSEAMKRRMKRALVAFGERPVPIICCGARGRDEPTSEAAAMHDWFLKNGVPPEQVLIEDQSGDTLENIAYAKKIMQARGLSRALVVTSDYHVRRALAICRRFGIPATGAASPSNKRYWLKNHLREMLAWGKFVLMRWRKY